MTAVNLKTLLTKANRNNYSVAGLVVISWEDAIAYTQRLHMKQKFQLFYKQDLLVDNILLFLFWEKCLDILLNKLKRLFVVI